MTSIRGLIGTGLMGLGLGGLGYRIGEISGNSIIGWLYGLAVCVGLIFWRYE